MKPAAGMRAFPTRSRADACFCVVRYALGFGMGYGRVVKEMRIDRNEGLSLKAMKREGP
jgi:hypothetical protein